MAIRVMVYDDNKMRQEALKVLIEQTTDMEFAGAKANCSEVEDDMTIFKPDVVLMDINMPDTNGIEGVKRIRKFAPNIYIIMQTVLDDADRILASIKAGANGYFLKKIPSSKLIVAINEVMNGGSFMTPSVAKKVLESFWLKPAANKRSDFNLSTREMDILKMLTEGMSYKKIAIVAEITFHTVNAHLKNIYEKLQVHSATEAVKKAIDNKLV